MVYLDYSATSPLCQESKDAMTKIMDQPLGNASSLHTLGSNSKNIYKTAKQVVASLINASESEIIFTSGGTESNNTVIKTFENCPILVSKIEHHSILYPAEEYGNPCIKIPTDKTGEIDFDFLKTKIEKITKKPYKKVLVSVMLANNETGKIENIQKIAEIIKNYKKVYLHTDATQAIGKIDVDVKNLGVNYLTFTSHKIGGPVGIGALYIKPGSPFKPLLLGGAQENKKRPGTTNVLLAEGFRAATERIKTKEIIKLYKEKISLLRNYLKTEIERQIDNIIINTTEPCLPNILNISFPGAEGESTQLYLDLEKIYVSTGSACASGDLNPSHVLMSMYNDPEVAHNSVRFSLGEETTKIEINKLLEKLPTIIKKIRDISTIKG